MRLLGSMIALFALTASAPAFAGDYTPYRHLTRDSATNVEAPGARPAAPAAHEDAGPCDCSCHHRGEGRRPSAVRVERHRH